MYRLEDYVVIVTGGARGIGKAISLMAASEGAQVVVNYFKSEIDAQCVVTEIRENKGKAIAIQGDVTKDDEVEKMVDHVYEKFGKIDVLVNNAGVIRDMLLVQMEWDDWHKVINVNLGGMFLCTKAVVKYMIFQKSGKIINVSSVAAEKGGKGHCNYASSKGGVNAFTRSMAVELAPKGIRVNAVAPGMILTDISKAVRRRANEKILSMIPAGRYGTPEEVAKVVTFLASDDASYITGEIINVTGGMSA
ncbi:MAG: 3-oxoacyl-ACP reductase FabG [Promethearchaeota archaeon]|jgi:3-oxoacyl-[acyl-carrier protein] reductase